MEPQDAKRCERVLILTPFGKDSLHLTKILSAEHFVCESCRDLPDLISKMDNVGVIVLTEEILSSEGAEDLARGLGLQPAWSAIPILAFYGGVSTRDAFDKKANHPLQKFAEITFIQRPVSAPTLIHAIHAALRDRNRQYDNRDLLSKLEAEVARTAMYAHELKLAKQQSDEARTIAERANLSKSQFLANMSHEIRTPLGAIIGFLELLKSEPSSKTESDNYISVIGRNSVHLLRLIDDILDLSKVEAGKMPIERVELSLSDLIADIASLMGFKAREKGIFFVLKFKNDLPERIFSDSVRLRQILTNVVGNAIKFTERGTVELAIEFQKPELKFTVTDTGRGISESERQRLFKPFSQADDSTTRQFGGTGLGLVLTRYLAEAMGGKFELAQSTKSKGSSFVASVRVDVPTDVRVINQESMEANAQTKETVREAVLTGLDVLLVDDSPDNQSLFAIFLSKAGAHVDVATNGAKGVESALKGTYDVVLMDVQMPEMDGHEATRLLRSKGYKAPIIALTAHAMKDEEERTRASGFSGFISKPVQREALIAAIVRQTHV